MPLLGELGDGVQYILSDKGIGIGSDLKALGNVEHWLTLLADPAPWLMSSEQMRNSALFNDVSEAIHEVVTAMQIRASIESPPPWLFDLIDYWDRTKSTVITFNYDCLVELAYEHIKATAVERGLASALYVIPITPAALRTSSILG